MPPHILSLIADNPALFEAVKEVFEKQLATDTLDGSGSDTDLGQKVRARLTALTAITKALAEIARYKTFVVDVGSVNPAR